MAVYTEFTSKRLSTPSRYHKKNQNLHRQAYDSQSYSGEETEPNLLLRSDGLLHFLVSIVHGIASLLQQTTSERVPPSLAPPCQKQLVLDQMRLALVAPISLQPHCLLLLPSHSCKPHGLSLAGGSSHIMC